MGITSLSSDHFDSVCKRIMDFLELLLAFVGPDLEDTDFFVSEGDLEDTDFFVSEGASRC